MTARGALHATVQTVNLSATASRSALTTLSVAVSHTQMTHLCSVQGGAAWLQHLRRLGVAGKVRGVEHQRRGRAAEARLPRVHPRRRQQHGGRKEAARRRRRGGRGGSAARLDGRGQRGGGVCAVRLPQRCDLHDARQVYGKQQAKPGRLRRDDEEIPGSAPNMHACTECGDGHVCGTFVNHNDTRTGTSV